MMHLDKVFSAANNLGEIPLWCPHNQQLYWTDIRACKLHSLKPATGEHREYAMPDWVGAIALCASSNSHLLIAARKSLLRFDLDTGAFQLFTTFEEQLATNRSNDGRCDRQGRFWLGTLNNAERIPTGSLYCFDGENITRHLDQIIVPNSLAWSPDSRTMYFADSWNGDLWAYDFDADDGAMSNRRVLVSKATLPGIPDGCTVDADGCLWQARYGAGQLVRITPEGKIDQVVHSDTLQLTACTFGGSDLSELYVTSARQRMSPSELAAQPDAGDLFVIRTAVAGTPEPRFSKPRA